MHLVLVSALVSERLNNKKCPRHFHGAGISSNRYCLLGGGGDSVDLTFIGTSIQRVIRTHYETTETLGDADRHTDNALDGQAISGEVVDVDARSARRVAEADTHDAGSQTAFIDAPVLALEERSGTGTLRVTVVVPGRRHQVVEALERDALREPDKQ